MATDDQQVLVTGTAAAPTHFTVPGNGQIQPKAVFAHYDGSAATTTFVPALKIISDGGEVVAICPCSTSVAAAGSADVTWFPHVGECDCETGGANYDAVVAAFGPWAYWKLTDGVGATHAVDSSGHGRTMVIDTGHVNMGQPGLIPSIPPQTCAFSIWTAGTNVQNFTTVSAQTYSASVVTVEHWVKTAGHGINEQDLSCMGTLNSPASRLWRCFLNSSGQPVFEFYGNDAALHNFTFAGGVDDNAPHQVVYVMDGAHVTCYLDGVLLGTQAAGATMAAPLTSDVYLCQPAGGAGSRDLDGYIGPVVVYDKALTAANIANLYANATGTTSGGGVGSVTAGDTSVVVGGTATDPTLETASVDVIAADHPTAADWSNNSHKITALAAGTAAGEAAVWDQTGAGIITAKGDIVAGTGSHAVSRLGVGADTNVLTADSTQATGLKWAAAGGSSPLTTKGDIFGHSTVDARIPVGSDGTILAADSTQALGVAWRVASSFLPGTGLNKLVSITLGSTAALDTGANAIPTGHGSLIVLIWCRTAAAATTEAYTLTLNGDSGAHYDDHHFQFSGGTQTSGVTVAATSWTASGLLIGDNDTASFVSPVVMFWPGYDDTNWFKSGYMMMAVPGSGGRFAMLSMEYRSTAAINQITLDTASHLLANSRMVVYGTE